MGGAGADSIVYGRLGEGTDLIYDFAAGEDPLVLRADLLNLGFVAGALDPT